jgi:hypothetical protein
MCTVGYLEDLAIVFKNRDKNVATEEEVIRKPGIVAMRTKGADYYSLGVNIYGCAFVSTAINTPKWTALAAAGNKVDAAKQFLIENDGLVSPTKLISRHLASVQSAQEMVGILEDSNQNFMGYNLVLIDRQGAFRVECYQNQRHITTLPARAVVTNHFNYVAHGPAKFEDYPSSFKREEEANNRIQVSKSMDDLWALMKFNNSEDEEQSIWRIGSKFWTVSSAVLDIKDCSLVLSETPILPSSVTPIAADERAL